MALFLKLPLIFTVASYDEIKEVKQRCELLGKEFKMKNEFESKEDLMLVNIDQIVCINESSKGNTVISLSDGSSDEYQIKFQDFLAIPEIKSRIKL